MEETTGFDTPSRLSRPVVSGSWSESGQNNHFSITHRGRRNSIVESLKSSGLSHRHFHGKRQGDGKRLFLAAHLLMDQIFMRLCRWLGVA